MEPTRGASMTNGKPVLVRCMEPPDIAAGIRLCDVAGWNQTEQDWRRFLMLEGPGCFVACIEGRVCATATALSYGERFGWIGMILVDPERRGRGIGTLLLKKTMDYLERSAIETMRLDATPMGHNLYLQLGFADEYGIERWHGVADTPTTARLQPMSRDELARVCLWDREAFGADRTRLLTRLWEEGRHYSAAVFSGGELKGYMLGRAGRRAHYLGPWAARGSDVAGQLFHEFLARVRGETAFVDVPSHNLAAIELARSAGFFPQRPLTRMYRGPHRFPGRPELICGIAGPELG